MSSAVLEIKTDLGAVLCAYLCDKIQAKNMAIKSIRTTAVIICQRSEWLQVEVHMRRTLYSFIGHYTVVILSA